MVQFPFHRIFYVFIVLSLDSCLVWRYKILSPSYAVGSSLQRRRGEYSRKAISVDIFHIIDNEKWGEVDGSALQGNFSCSIPCRLHSSDTKDSFMDTVKKKFDLLNSGGRANAITVSMYNIHTWKMLAPSPYRPDKYSLPTTLTVAESEESHGRFKHLFDTSFPHFDGWSTTHPQASIRRYYIRGLNSTDFLPMPPYRSLVKGAAYVASTCHRGSKRDSVVKELSQHIRVDSLGKCLKTPPREGSAVLLEGRTPLESLQLKQKALSRYMFYLAFENTKEPGYVTEKVFDALISGVVPVYFGATEDCRHLIPAREAAIFLDDFDGDEVRLAHYLTMLMSNDTAYEVHRQWRKGFDPDRDVPAEVKRSWPCRVCEWAVNKVARGSIELGQV